MKTSARGFATTLGLRPSDEILVALAIFLDPCIAKSSFPKPLNGVFAAPRSCIAEFTLVDAAGVLRKFGVCAMSVCRSALRPCARQIKQANSKTKQSMASDVWTQI
mmetsp:Transcript_11962/g.18934  ORF Transcript_11962/g.18934 Transcript_11962/m.18934 type:complete len:106 (+) Transcript_11962:1475-1792(+)